MQREWIVKQSLIVWCPISQKTKVVERGKKESDADEKYPDDTKVAFTCMQERSVVWADAICVYFCGLALCFFFWSSTRSRTALEFRFKSVAGAIRFLGQPGLGLVQIEHPIFGDT